MKTLKIIAIVLIVTCIAFTAYAEESKRMATVVSVTGVARAKISGASRWVNVGTGMMLAEGDTVKTAAGSSVKLNLEGCGIVEVDENSDLLLAELTTDEDNGAKNTLLDLALGEVMIQADRLASPESSFEVKTPTSIVGVRGTRFTVKVEAME